MDYKIEKNDKRNIVHYEKEDIDIALDFAKEAKKEFKDLIKAIVLFGSTARKKVTHQKNHDIDILLVIDDISIQLSSELIQTYRIILEKTVLKISRRLHITSLKLTNFWEYVRVGDPIAINILRDGVAILDTGFFSPLQLLLSQGRIRPSPESVQNYMMLAPQTLQNSRAHILQATLDLYWAVIDSAHAALMHINEIPPSPAHVSDLIQEKLVKTNIMPKRIAVTMKRFYDLGKSVMHGELNYISGQQYDVYYKEAHEFVMEMKKFIEKR